MKDQILHFVDTFDFDELMEMLSKIHPSALATDIGFIVPAVIFLGLLIYPKTRDETLYLSQILISAVYVVVTLVVLRNSNLGDIGPFAMFLVMILVGVGFFIKNYLLK